MPHKPARTRRIKRTPDNLFDSCGLMLPEDIFLEFLFLLGKKNEVFQEAQLLRNCAERLYLALKVPDAFVLPVEKIAPVIAHPPAAALSVQ